MIGATKPNPTFARWFATVHRGIVRLSGGRLLTGFRGEPMILLTTVGRRSGQPRTWPLSALRVGGGWAVAASNGGHDRHPAWFLNLQANPDVDVVMRDRSGPMRARVASREEKAALWPQVVAAYGDYAVYQQRTERDIPLHTMPA